MWRIRTILFTVVFAAIAGSAAAQNAPAGSKGKDMYAKYMCYTCHGWDGHGGSGAVLMGMKLNQNGFVSYVRAGGTVGRIGAAGRMPSYSTKVLPDPDLVEIFNYIKSWPEAKPAKDIPLLNQLLREN